MKKENIIIIDGSSYFERISAFRASESGINKNELIKSFVGILRLSLKKHNPSQLVIGFPLSYDNVDNDLFNEIKCFSDALGIPLVFNNSIYSIVQSLNKNKIGNESIILSTCNKIYLQVISSEISIEDMLSQESYNNENIYAKIGVYPEQIPDLLAISGDRENGLPIIPKVGIKNATKWLHEFSSLQNLINSIEQISGPSADSFRSNKQVAIESYNKIKLIDYDDYQFINTKRQKINVSVLYDLYIKNKFYEWLPFEIKNKYVGKNGELEDTKTNAILIDSLDKLIELSKKLSCQKGFSIFIEKSNQDMIGIGISYQDSHGFYIPFVTHSDNNSKVGIDFIVNQLKPILENNKIKKVSFESKLLYKSMRSLGINIDGLVSDIETVAYTINTANGKKDIYSLANSELGLKITNKTPYGEHNKKFNSFKIISSFDMCNYIAEKADIIWRLNKHLYIELNKDISIRRVYEQYEMPLINVLSKMEDNGVRVDASVLINQSNEITSKMESINQDICKMAGQEINLDSPQQVSDFLFNKLKLPVLKGKDATLSTSEEVLSELSTYHEAPGLIIKYRSLSKLKSSYTDGLIKKINPSTGRLHTTFNQTITSTGRLSSKDPNLQNIPIKSEEGRRIRRSFVPSQGNYIMSADYSQIELRILAHFSRDERLINAFKNGEDIHRATAAEVFGIPFDKVTKEQRRSAKSINFGIIYGMTASGLAKELNISWKNAQAYIDKYFNKFTGVYQYLQQTKHDAHNLGYIKTISGRKIYFDKINSQEVSIMRAAERAAINAPMQGSASDIIKKAMIEIDSWMRNAGLQSKMILQIHDELVFDAIPSEIKILKEGINRIMSQSTVLHVPLVVEIDIGKNWEQSHSLEDIVEHGADLIA